MNKLAQRIFVLVALLSCVAIAAAQGGGGGGQGRRGGGQRGGRGNSEMSLAMRADVQKELAVTDDQKTKLTDLQAKSRQGFGRGNGGGGNGGGGNGGGAGAGNGTPPDPAAMQKMMADRMAQQHKDLAAILNDGQMKRLGELLLQRESFNALTQEGNQKALGLSSDQVAKIKDLQAKQTEANTSIRDKVRNQEMTQEEATAARQKNAKTFSEEVAKVLTADQAAKFKDMQGKAFTFDTGTGGGGG